MSHKVPNVHKHCHTLKWKGSGQATNDQPAATAIEGDSDLPCFPLMSCTLGQKGGYTLLHVNTKTPSGLETPSHSAADARHMTSLSADLSLVLASILQ